MPSSSNINDSLLTILQWNTRSLSARLIDIPHLLSSNSTSVALLSETWLHPNKRTKIPGYHLVRDDRSDGYGGAAIAIKNSVNFRKLDINPNLSQSLADHNINLVGVKILSKYDQTLDIWSCYIPPYSNISQLILNDIFNVMSNYCIFGDDLNGHHSCWSSNRNDHQGCIIHSTIENL